MMLAQLMKDMQVGLTLKGTHTHDSDIWLCRRRPSSNIYFKGTLSKKATCRIISNDFIVSSNSSIILNICVVYNKQYKTSKKHLSNGLFRPSTGIISLIYAIQIHGVNATYFICGIGIKQRDKYPDGINNTWSPSKSMASFHVYADKIILKKLKKKYDLRFDDIDFSNF